MRTTFTVEEDLAPQLERLRKARGESLAKVVNDLVRAGLESIERPRRRPKYRMKKTFAASSQVGSLDRISAVLEFGEGE